MVSAIKNETLNFYTTMAESAGFSLAGLGLRPMASFRALKACVPAHQLHSQPRTQRHSPVTAPITTTTEPIAIVATPESDETIIMATTFGTGTRSVINAFGTGGATRFAAPDTSWLGARGRGWPRRATLAALYVP